MYGKRGAFVNGYARPAKLRQCRTKMPPCGCAASPHGPLDADPKTPRDYSVFESIGGDAETCAFGLGPISIGPYEFRMADTLTALGIPASSLAKLPNPKEPAVARINPESYVFCRPQFVGVNR